MTREEEIKHASKDYVNYLLDKQEYHNEKYTEYDIKQAFEKGAEWADKHPKNVWHDVSEEPLLEETEIIFINEQDIAYICERNGGSFSYTFLDYSWEEYVNSLKIKKWAYISDLLPKGDER